MKLSLKFFVVLATIFSFAFTTSAYADIKVATVEVTRVIASSSQVKQLKAEQLKKNQDMAKWLDKAKVEVHKQTSETEKKKLLKKYNDEFDKKKADLAKDYAKKLAEIDKNISDAIAVKAKEKGYDLVFAKATVLYGADDITEDIIKAVK